MLRTLPTLSNGPRHTAMCSSNFARRARTRLARRASALLLSSSLALGSAAADTLRVGIDDRIASTVLFVAAAEGYFERESLDVELVETPAGDDLIERLADEEVEMGLLTSDGLLRAQGSGTDLRGAYVLSLSNAADAIVARREIRDTRRLRGRRVAFEPGSAGELLLRSVLQKKGRRLDDVTQVSLTAEAAAAALRQGDVDAAVLHEPGISGFVGDPEFRLIATAADSPGLVSDLLVGTDGYLNRTKEDTKGLIRAIARAVAWMRRHPGDAARILADRYALDEQRAAEALDGVSLLDVTDNMSLLRGEYQKSFSAMSEVLSSGLGEGRAREVPSANRYLSLSALRQVAAGR